MIPQTLYNLNLFIDGVNFAGIATQVTPPKLKIKAEDYRGGGMDAPIKMDLGLEALEANFALSGISIDALRLFGLADQSAFNGVFRGGQTDIQYNADQRALAVLGFDVRGERFPRAGLAELVGPGSEISAGL